MRNLTGWACYVVLAGSVLAQPAHAQAGSAGQVLPAVFVEDRIFLRPVTLAGDTLTFYTDSGGGMNMLFAPAAARLALPLAREAAGSDTVTLAPWPEWREGASIPSAGDGRPLGDRLMVVPVEGPMATLMDSTDAGFLGARWFAGRTWTFDYPASRLTLWPAGALPPHQPGQRVPLGFQADSSGERTTHFPRIRVSIAGDSLDLLFDTGATMLLTDSALAVLGDGRPARRAASFISANVLNRWRTEHPEWRVVERATSFGAPMIEVPEIVIAGQRVGPVWFEGRPPHAFEEWMSQWMDAPIVGALGGNALRFFRVSVDYPGAVAIFQRP